MGTDQERLQQPLAPEDRLLTRVEVAVLFKVKPRTVTKWAIAKKLPCIRTLGGHRRYREKVVLALLADRENPPPPPPPSPPLSA